MNVVKCNNNHYYDSDIYGSSCPHCANGLQSFDDESQETIQYKFASIYSSETKKEKKKRIKEEKKKKKQDLKDISKSGNSNQYTERLDNQSEYTEVISESTEEITDKIAEEMTEKIISDKTEFLGREN